MSLSMERCPGCDRLYADPVVSCTRQSMMTWVCNLPAEKTRREETAGWLLWLAMLIDRAQRIDGGKGGLREQLSKGARVGEKWAPTVPHEDEPDATLPAGTVRFDAGPVTIRVLSESEFKAWVRKHYPSRIVTQLATDGRRAASEDELDTLAKALAEVTAGDYRGFDPYHSMAAALWDRLQDAGQQLAPMQRVEERSAVDRDWADQLVKDLKAHAKTQPPGDVKPVDGNGVPIEGISVTVGPPKLVVTPSHDGYVVDTYARQLTGQGLRELMPPEQEKR